MITQIFVRVKLPGEQRSVLGMWQYTDCSVWVLATVLVDYKTCITPSREEVMTSIESPI